MSRASTPKWFKAYLGRYKSAVAITLALGIVASGCAALLMFTSGYLISATALAGTTLFSIMVPVACVQLFGFGRPLARYLERLESHDWVLHITSDLRRVLFQAVEERTGDPARERAMGEYLGLLTDDVAHLQNLYLRVVFPTAIAYLLALGVALTFGFFSAPFALIVLLSLVVVAVALPLCCLLVVRVWADRAKSLKAAEYVALADDVYGAVDWVLAGRSAEALAMHASSDAVVRLLEQRERTGVRAASLAASVLLVVLLCGVVVWSAGRFGSGSADVNWIAAFALGFFPLIEAFVALPSAFAESTKHRISIARLDDLISGGASDPEPSGNRNGRDEGRYLADRQTGFADGADGSAASPCTSDDAGAQVRPDLLQSQDPQRTPLRAGAVSLSHVTYSYPGASGSALEDVSIAFEPGESIAVLGRSGAGKTTLARLLCGSLEPDAGTVLGCEEGDVGYVGQEPYLFNRTLRDNLTLGVTEAADERLVSILASVGLGSKLSSLPDGLDTVVGETGIGFSGGEAHRIAIARVLVANAPVVVVDEPFSALDPDTERGLLDTLFAACANRTLIVITHHLKHVERFDRVVFIEDGRIGLTGSPSELMESSERFQELISFDDDAI